MRSLLLAVAVAASGAWAVIHHLPEEAEAAGPARAADEVQSVALDGHSLPQAALRALLETKPGARLDAAALERDRAAIEDALAARGYLSATVAAPAVTHGARGGAYVVFDVEKGPLFRVRSVVVSGPGERDRDVVTLGRGEPADRERIGRARDVLATTLARHRSRPQVELVVKDDRDAAAVDVELVTR